MIYRPHFTYIEAATPEQTQAREAAADEEWRKRLISHPPVLPPIRIEPLPIVRPPTELTRGPIEGPPIRISPLPIINPPVLPGLHVEPLPIPPELHNITFISPPKEEGKPKEPIEGPPVHIEPMPPVRPIGNPPGLHIEPLPIIRGPEHRSNLVGIPMPIWGIKHGEGYRHSNERGPFISPPKEKRPIEVKPPRPIPLPIIRGPIEGPPVHIVNPPEPIIPLPILRAPEPEPIIPPGLHVEPLPVMGPPPPVFSASSQSGSPLPTGSPVLPMVGGSNNMEVSGMTSNMIYL